MAEPFSDKPLYGDFGHATYDKNSKEWQFRRADQPPDILLSLGESAVVISPPDGRVHASQTDFGKVGPARRREVQAKRLVQSYPELESASVLLPNLARTSEAVERAAGHHDSSKGNLLAFGRIPDQITKEQAQVMAFPSGPTGSDLRIVQIQAQRRGWEGSRAAWLEVPTPHGEEATWTGPGVPIQSILFAQPKTRRDVYLVVRLSVETLIFRPLLRKTVTQTSRLDPNLSYRFSIHETDGTPHAHLTFNPWESHQFAVVDQSGSSSVRNLGNRKAGFFRGIWSDALPPKSFVRASEVFDDGWARVSWIGSSNVVAVCSRRTAKVCNITNETAHILPKPPLYLNDGLDWNLDMVVLPAHDNHLTILTSTHILVYLVKDDGQERPSSEMVASLRHYRNSEDTSMCLHVFQDTDDVCMCIRSELNQPILLYRLTLSWTGRIAISDPIQLSLPLAVPHGTLEKKLLDMHVQAISGKQIEDARHDDIPTLQHIEGGSRFYAMTTLHKDLSIMQTLYITSRDSRKVQIVPLTWTGRFPKSAKSASRVSRQDDFVVDDKDQSAINDTESIRNEPESKFVQRRRGHEPNYVPRENWTINHEQIAQRLNNVETANVEIGDTLSVARELLSSTLVGLATPFRTLRELAGAEITLDDSESASAAVQEVVNLQQPSQSQQTLEPEEPSEGTRLFLQTPIVPPALHPLQPNRLDAQYQYIIENWISPLTGDLPEVARTNRENLARQVASEITLGSHILRPEAHPPESPGDQPSESQNRSQSQTLRLPVRASVASSSRATQNEYFDASSQLQSPTSSPHAQPGASQTPSTITTSSHPSTFTAPQISRLSRYTTFSKPPPPLPPRSLNRILAHWQPGTDPANYDWRSVSRRFQTQEEHDADNEDLTDKERRRLQRRTERYVRRQRREAEESQRLQALSSQAPAIVVASQPTQDLGQSLDAPGAGSSQLAASQAVPGRHAGRRPARKKRKSGF